jgi:endonuclease-3
MKRSIRKLQQKTLEIIAILENKFPVAECALLHKSPWELLVATILSAQCTDKRVNLVTTQLFARFPDLNAFATADLAEVEQAIKSTGFFRNKAKNIVACAQKLSKNHKGRLPQKLDQLIKLPGVGRKTASVVLGTSFNKAEGIVVDTHVKRLAFRFGLTEETAPEKVETDLLQIVPQNKWIAFSHLLILHGRSTCKARNPDCINCELNEICSYARNHKTSIESPAKAS